MPGFVDTHIHAPQYKFTGTSYDKTLLEWLDAYTYPVESTFSSVEVARKLYPLVVVRTSYTLYQTQCINDDYTHTIKCIL